MWNNKKAYTILGRESFILSPAKHASKSEHKERIKHILFMIEDIHSCLLFSFNFLRIFIHEKSFKFDFAQFKYQKIPLCRQKKTSSRRKKVARCITNSSMVIERKQKRLGSELRTERGKEWR